MTLQDRDLERAIASLADEVVLEAADVDAAFTDFTDRSARASRRRRGQRLAAACAAAALLLGGATAYWAVAERGTHHRPPPVPAATPSVISPEEMVGVWTGLGLWTFYADGTGGYSNNANTLETPFHYTLKGNKLGVRDATGCDFSFRLTGYRQSRQLTGDVLEFCGNTAPPVSLVRLSPASPAGTEIPMFSMTGATPVRRVAQVGGVWIMPGTGMLLAIDGSRGTYALDDRGNLARNPRDSGTVTVSSDGTVTLTSSQSPTAGCASPGRPRTVLRDVMVVAAQSVEAKGGVTPTCARATVQAGWVLVSTR